MLDTDFGDPDPSGRNALPDDFAAMRSCRKIGNPSGGYFLRSRSLPTMQGLLVGVVDVAVFGGLVAFGAHGLHDGVSGRG